MTVTRNCFRFIFICLLSLSPILADEKGPVGTSEELLTLEDTVGYNTRTLVDGLNQANLQEAFRLLRSEYIKKQDLDYLSLNRAAMQGILDRLDFGAMLLTEADRSARNSPYTFHAARIEGQTAKNTVKAEELKEKVWQYAYIRFGRFNKAELTSFDEALSEFRDEEKIATLILDLRSPQAQADFIIASEILSRFRPPNELLFKIRRPGNERPALFPSKPSAVSWAKEIVILVDSETGNVGEIIAAVLQRKNNSLVIGEKTKGLTVEYRDVSIGEDRILRYAIAEVILDDESSIFQTGISPELPADPDLAAKHSVFEAITAGEPISKYLLQRERPRLNEAALVAGTDPELEYFLAKSNDRKTEWDIILPEDNVLQKAVDILRTRDYLESGKRKKKRY